MRIDVEIEVLSPLQLGYGGADIIIDSEAAHDKYGLPVFPAKRLKGLLYESALEMSEISGGKWFTNNDVDCLFGHSETEEAGFRIDNFYLPDYSEMCKSWKYLQNTYSGIFTPELVFGTYTDVRFQTSIDKKSGTTKDGSLHNMRVVDSGVKFNGSIYLKDDSKINKDILRKALLNLRYAGGKRNRGCGHIKCSIIAEENC